MKLVTTEMVEQIEQLFNVMDITKSGMLSCHDMVKFQDLININQIHHDDRNIKKNGVNENDWENDNQHQSMEQQTFEKNLDTYLLSS